MSLKLYGSLKSTASERVQIALNLKGLAYEYIPTSFSSEQTDDNYLKVNPSGLIPTLVDDDEDIILNQSLAIIEYLDERVPDVCPLMPPHKVARARVRALCQDLVADVQPLINLRVLSFLKSEFGLEEASREKWNQFWIEQGLAPIEKRLQTTAGEYCFGFDLSVADVCLVPMVQNAERFKIDLSAYPVVQKIYKNCMKLDAFQLADSVSQPSEN